MRLLTLILLLFISTAANSIELSLEALIGTECERELKEAKELTTYVLYAARQGKWSEAYRFMDSSFYHILRSQTYCVDEPENLVVARKLMEEHNTISRELDCSFHTIQTHTHLGEGKAAKTLEDAKYHTDWAMYHTDEALLRCKHKPERMEALKRVKPSLTSLSAIIQMKIDAQ